MRPVISGAHAPKFISAPLAMRNFTISRFPCWAALISGVSSLGTTAFISAPLASKAFRGPDVADLSCCNQRVAVTRGGVIYIGPGTHQCGKNTNISSKSSGNERRAVAGRGEVNICAYALIKISATICGSLRRTATMRGVPSPCRTKFGFMPSVRSLRTASRLPRSALLYNCCCSGGDVFAGNKFTHLIFKRIMGKGSGRDEGKARKECNRHG